MTFVDSIVSGTEQKRRFVFTQNGGGEEAGREGGGVTLASTQILLRPTRPFFTSGLASGFKSAVTHVDVELVK